MYRIFRRLFRRLPFLPTTLEQDLGNPLQRDRLPDTRNIELEFPVVSGTLEQNQRFTRRWVAIVIAFSTFVAAIEIHITHTMFASIPNLVAVAGFVLVWLSYLAVRRLPLMLVWVWIVTPHAMLALLMIADPSLAWLMGGVMTVLVGDLLATHYLHLQTTAPLERKRALELRRLWKSRFGLVRGVTGGELYLISFLYSLAAVIGFLAADHFATADYAVRNLYRLMGIACCLIAATVALEFLAAFLFARSVLRPRLMLRHLGAAVTQWLTYNRTQIDAPGAYQTPAGACKYRKLMALGLLLMLSAAVPQFVSPSRDLELIDAGRHPTFGPEPAETVDTKSDREESTDLTASKADSAELQLYQQRMLERMPEDQRQDYLARLEQQQQAKLDAVQHESDSADSADTPTSLPSWLDETFSHALTTFYMGLNLLVLPILCALTIQGLFFAFVFAATGRLAGRYGPLTSISPDEILSWDRWDDLVARVQNSDDKTEQTSLLLGVNAVDNTPILVPRSVFTEHAHLLGDSGSGKTSIGIASILSQLIRCQKCSVVVLDLKGDDLALFQGVKSDADDARLRFRWFTNQLEHSTYAFNPLQQAPLQRMTVYQKVDMLTAGMGLQYGRDYGRAYYSDANARLLHAALEQHGQIPSFARLADILNDPNGVKGVDRDLRQAGAHLGAIVNRLADTEALNVVRQNGQPNPIMDAAIEFTDVFRKPEVVHFHLTSTIGTTSSAEMARIALYSLITAASAVPPKDRIQTFVVIDEFQRIVAGNIELLLQLARSLNIGIILANQSLMDLKTAGIDLIPAISANTRFRQIFAASNLEEQERISRGSGEALAFQQSWHEYIGGFTTLVDGRNLSETITPRLRINDILLATDHPLQSIVQIRRGAGYAQYGGLPFVMRSSFLISKTAYDERKRTGWPVPTTETLVPQIRQEPRSPGNVSGWYRDEDVIVDRPAADASGHFLDQLYQQQLDAADNADDADAAASAAQTQETDHD